MKKVFLIFFYISLLSTAFPALAQEAQGEDHSAFFSRVLDFAANPPAPFAAVKDVSKFKFVSGKVVTVAVQRFSDRNAEIQVVAELLPNPNSLFLPKPLASTLRMFFKEANIFSTAALSPEELEWMCWTSGLDEDCMNSRSCRQDVLKKKTIDYIFSTMAISRERLAELDHQVTYELVEILTFGSGAKSFDALTDKDRVILGVYPHQEIKFQKPKAVCTGYADAPLFRGVDSRKPSVDPCCGGLVLLRPKYMFNADCSDRYYVGATPLCLACGDGSCDSKYENHCNCPQDCK